MATTGTYTFNLSLDETLEEAAQLAELKIEEANGLWARSGKRSLDLILSDWANRGVKLWTLDLVTVALVQGTQTITIPAQYYDVLEVAVRIDNQDTRMERLDTRRWLEQANKLDTGKPNSYLVQRGQSAVTITLWPIPDAGNYTLVYFGIRYTQDSTSLSANPDVARRFLPALVAGVAIELVRKSDKDREVKASIISDLKPEYEERLERAMLEDAERTSMFIQFDRA